VVGGQRKQRLMTKSRFSSPAELLVDLTKNNFLLLR